ncbi:uncharacterized protein FOMMEDRAFT_170573 [Fomitiporia mediterranea MF3/22]|uniref:uncharacterized protein n=1 Tax=Fomitiporia mediterranea (strain MF3/22) TaxID=694068 RepID=UPI0004408E9D|nr:uncharacterized protein FOMMEDRAFT_170573 [Fomitiporia mediterranea MF3/22]EJC99255.1 hypothetical protein FOMMEDRAFT_170573 [Fomitiporia mediterranea MF3/22]
MKGGPVTVKTTLSEDSENWEFVRAKDNNPSYHIYTAPVQTSNRDYRKYAVIRLNNGLEAVVINDIYLDTSAAWMDVAIGKFNDPLLGVVSKKDMAGTAHFCEHLLAMGSVNHPEENAFDEYLALNNGFYNASSGPSNTEFHFEVASDALEGALDRFSAFFYCPRFHKGSALREVEAVNSEYSGKLQDDMRRLEYVEYSLAHPSHPLRKFGTGNEDTLLGKFLTSRASPLRHESDKNENRCMSGSPRRNSGSEIPEGSDSSFSRISSFGKHVKDERNSWSMNISETSLGSVGSRVSFPPTKQLTENGRGHRRSVSNSSTQSTYSPPQTPSDSESSHVSRQLSRSPSKTDSQAAKEEAKKVAALKAREYLKKWWEREYCAERMKLAIAGNEPLHKMIDMAVRFFSPIKSRGQYPADISSSKQPYGKEELGKIVYVKTIGKMYKIIIVFPISWQTPLWREKPAYYVVHLLGHEGPSSLHAYLKNKGWLLRLVAGQATYGPGISLLKLTLDLTKEGLENHREVIVTCFKFINLLRKYQIPEWVPRERWWMEWLSFNYDREPEALLLVEDIVGSMKYPTPRALLLNGPLLPWELNEKLIGDTLENLDAENCYVIVAARNHDHIPTGETWHKERWFGAEYVKKQFDAKFISETRKGNDIPDLALPGPNPFIPKNFALYGVHGNKPKQRPTLIMRAPNIEVWHNRNVRFRVPHVWVHIAARTPVAGATTRARILTQMFVALVEDAIHGHAFYAEVAGLTCKLLSATRGFEMQFNGFSDKLHDLVQAVLEQMKYLKIQKDRLKILMKQERRILKDRYLEYPCDLSESHLLYLIEDDYLSTEERLNELKDITVEELSKHVQLLLSRLNFVILTNCNLRKEDALKLASLVEKTFEAKAIPKNEVPMLRSRLLPKGCNYVWDLPVLNSKEANSSVLYYCYVGNQSNPCTRVKCHLISQILDESAFDILRTKQQLGYIVYSRTVTDIELIGWRLVIESELDTKYLESRIDAFLIYMRKVIRTMSDEMFESHKRSLRRQWTEMPKGMIGETERFWSAIQDGYYDFKENQKNAELLPSIKLWDVRTMFEKFFDPSSATRSKISIHMRSQLPPKVPEHHASPNVSRKASQEFLRLLRKEHISVREDEYHQECDVEPTLHEMYKYLKKTCFSELLDRDDRKVKGTYQQLRSLVKDHPVKPALEVKHVKDGTKFKCGLDLSGVAMSIETFEEEH